MEKTKALGAECGDRTEKWCIIFTLTNKSVNWGGGEKKNIPQKIFYKCTKKKKKEY
jgi:hypothetical protein